MAINNPVITDSDWLQATAAAIQNKDGGGKIEVPDFASRVDALPAAPVLIPKTISENGVYNANSDNADGYDVVTVDVPERNILDEYFSNTLVVANIPSATTIIDNFFNKKSNLVNVIMPNVTSIGTYAFYRCVNLALTSLPNGITTIGPYGFSGCHNLTLTSLPNSITNLGQNSFQSCYNLALTSLPNGITRLRDAVFSGCRNLALTSLPNSITAIDGYSFENCYSIPYLDFSNFTNIPTLGANAFKGTTFPFYFRDQQQLDEWAAATNWSTYANRFQIKPSEVI